MHATSPTIVLALDGSASSLVARDLVAALPWPADTRVHVVAAHELPVDLAAGLTGNMAWVGEVAATTGDELRSQLVSLTAPLAKEGLVVESHVLAGRAATSILALADEVHADLIVVGSRGRGPLQSMLLGSVAAEVAGHAHVPVLVARRPSIERFLVATDGSTTAAAIPERLAGLRILAGARADVVAVTVPDPPLFEMLTGLYTLGDERLGRMRAELAEHSRATLEQMTFRLSAAGFEATPHLRHGDAAHEIVAVAEERDADLVVLGSRGLSGIDLLMLGSVARNVLLHARCSVLVVRD